MMSIIPEGVISDKLQYRFPQFTFVLIFLELMELWEWSLEICKDTEMKARIRGVQGMMTTFSFYFGCTLGEFVLKHTDNLSRVLQGSSISAAQGQQVAEDVCKTLSRDRSEAAFDLFWTRLLKRKS